MKYSMLFFSLLFLLSCKSNDTAVKSASADKVLEKQKTDLEGLSSTVFASGCFWCVEAIFESVTGVEEVISGYAGGTAQDANYTNVSNGITDHAEAVQIFYNEELINYNTLLKVFFGSHDPTTLNKQGPDRGRQYRSTIFYKNEEEKIQAEVYMKQLISEKVFSKITTTLEPLTRFYPAEEYHQDFERRNPNQGYIKAVSIPRLKRFQAKFPELLKDSAH